jgi:hypothetical protein
VNLNYITIDIILKMCKDNIMKKILKFSLFCKLQNVTYPYLSYFKLNLLFTKILYREKMIFKFLVQRNPRKLNKQLKFFHFITFSVILELFFSPIYAKEDKKVISAPKADKATEERAEPVQENNVQFEPTFPKSLKFGAFVDSYYLYNNNLPKSTERKYTTQAVRNTEFNMNLAYVDAKVEENRYRGRLALQVGTSVNINYSSELSKDLGSNQSSVRNIQEAYVGFKIAKNTWIDSGIFFGNIGRESWISHTNWNYTRAFALDYVPYYSSGIKLSHEFTNKLSVQLQILNGWQIITDNNRDKSFGSQIKYLFSPNLILTLNQYAGNDAPDSERRQMRFYNNTILEWNVLDWLSFAGQFDIGAQKAKLSLVYEPWSRDLNPDAFKGDFREAPANAFRQWYHGTFWISFKLNPEYRLSFRVERMYDPLQVVAVTNTRNGFMTNGYTTSFDVLTFDPGLLRFEYVYRRSADSVFDYRDSHTSKKEDFFVMAFSLKI